MIKTLSVLGSGWLGQPLAEHFVSKGRNVKASTTSKNRLQEVSSLKIEAFILDIARLSSNVQDFLKANVLIINIPSKNIQGFSNLIKEIENSEIEKVLFVSSTSVYSNENRVIFESDEQALISCPLLKIEKMFVESRQFKTTIVRFGGLIGYSRNPGRFFKKGRLIANPDSHVNLIHRDDCVHIISQIVEQDVWGEVFNCCADTHPTKREFYTLANELIGSGAPAFEKTQAKSFKIISNQKVKRLLDYQFLYPDLIALLNLEKQFSRN